ncbi:MAG: efflux RND transporter periplasmic adaptor subunit [Candidatus Endonucleobacter bathymodioli]|uniref:Efflux RND transporter periplasmic adaptor subunit n=1 Tax=Candidatus Endonucleibacter bathymodioli TaxID=539814 RepID=A0AA90NNC9_9GAMM|nr:efflux RND transporter periplasmic adaptor subunit [Candidatus Endonucleobacter bathymodioli]
MPTTVLTLIIISSMFLGACDSGQPLSKDMIKSPVRPAKLMEVGQSSTSHFLKYPAVIHSQQLSVLSFGVGGMLQHLNVIEAQMVKKGDVLAELDQSDLLAKLTSARSQLKNANAEYERALYLMKRDAISKSKLEERKSTLDVNQSLLEIAEKALRDSVLIAPFTGAISKVSIEKRQIIQPGEPAISILGKGGLEAKINLPSSMMTKANGQGRTATDSYLVLHAAPDRHIPIAFKESSLEADGATQSYEVTFSFEVPKDLIILPGMNAVAWFKAPIKSTKDIKKLLIPLTAIAIDGEQKYVWVVDKDSMMVSRRNIMVEAGVGVNLSVISGLESAEIIVVAGVYFLSEGVKVRPWSKD